MWFCSAWHVGALAALCPHLPRNLRLLGDADPNQGRIVLANFNSGHKVEPQIFAVWMNVLRACPACELWLLQVGVFSDELLLAWGRACLALRSPPPFALPPRSTIGHRAAFAWRQSCGVRGCDLGITALCCRCAGTVVSSAVTAWGGGLLLAPASREDRRGPAARRGRVVGRAPDQSPLPA
jgi:hypothetical protein